MCHIVQLCLQWGWEVRSWQGEEGVSTLGFRDPTSNWLPQLLWFLLGHCKLPIDDVISVCWSLMFILLRDTQLGLSPQRGMQLAATMNFPSWFPLGTFWCVLFTCSQLSKLVLSAVCSEHPTDGVLLLSTISLCYWLFILFILLAIYLVNSLIWQWEARLL